MTGRPPDHDLLGEPEQAAPSEEDERGADIFPTEEPPPADRYSGDLPLEAPPSEREQKAIRVWLTAGHRSSHPVSDEIPSRRGPRHCGQSAACRDGRVAARRVNAKLAATKQVLVEDCLVLFIDRCRRKARGFRWSTV